MARGSGRASGGVAALLLGSLVAEPASAQSGAGAPRPAVTVVEADARLTLRSDPPGVALYRQVVSAGSEQAWELICTAPCTFVMREGNYSLAASWGGTTKPVGVVAIPGGGGTLYARWKEQKISPFRVVVGVAALAGGTAMMLGSGNDTEAKPILLWGGLGLAVLGAGLTLSAFFNAPRVSVQHVGSRAASPLAGGLSLRGSF